MTETTHDNGSSARKVASLTDDVGQLVRMGGRRATMPATSLDRMQSELRPLWQDQVERHSPARDRYRLVAAAAVVAVALAVAFFGRAFFQEEGAVFATVARLGGSASAWSGAGADSAELLGLGTALETGRSVATANGSRIALETVNGHSLRLDHGTRIVLVSKREVRLEQGAVYVESAVDGGGEGRTGAGLSILTPFGRVDEIGTQFEVRLGSDALTVRIREGEVSVGTEKANERGVAGEELTVSAGAVRHRPIDPYDAVFDWMQRIAPAWPLDGSRLETFLGWAARESGFELEYSGREIAEEAGEVVLSGEVDGLSPREALDVVLPAVGLTHRFEGDALFISRLASASEPRS